MSFDRSALLVIDLQYLDAAPGYGPFATPAEDRAVERERARFFERLEQPVLPNVARLQKAFRGRFADGLEVIHTRIQSMTQDGRDRGPGHKALGLHAPPGSKEAEFLPQVAPIGDELIFNKTASGVFNSTNIDYVLRNLRIGALYVVGVYTNECVSTTVRDACDRGFDTAIIEDACAGSSAALHDATIEVLRDRYARILDTDQALAVIGA
jgi:nicotinamidase-related amidase